MFHVVLLEPEIPQNTGNIIRLCANTGATLHLIKPLGFRLEDSQLKRAGLDYHEWAEMQVHESLAAFEQAVRPPALYAFSTHGRRGFQTVQFQPGDALLFGPETRGLGQKRLAEMESSHVLRIPMRPNNRSLHLSNSVAVAVYEAWRQQGYDGA